MCRFCLSRFAVVALLAAAWFAPAAARAQLTVSTLIGQIVDDPEAEKYKKITEAIEKFKVNEVEAARTLMVDASKANADLPPSGILMAQMFAAANNAEAARIELEKTVIDSPQDPEPYLVFGDNAFGQRLVTDAGVLFEKAEQLSKTYTGNNKRKEKMLTRSYAGLAAVAESREQWSEAEKHLRAWLAIDKEASAAKSRLGTALFRQNKEKDAYTVFQDLHKDDETQRRPEISMALLYEQQAQQGDSEKHANAKKLMQLATQRDPDSLNTRLMVAQWALASCELDMVESNAAAALKLDSQSLLAKLLAGQVAWRRDDFKTAEEMFASAHAQAPTNFEATNQLALALIEQPDEGKRGQALEYAQVNAQLNGKSPVAAVTLAWVLQKLGRDFEAARVLQQVISGGGTIGSDSGYFTAVILAKRNQKDAAVQILEPILNQPGCFKMREEAQKLLDKLKKDDLE